MQIVNSLTLQLSREIDLEHDVVFFDEIQACPRALHSLKYFQEQMPSLSVCAAGSLLGVTLSREPFPVGKVDTLRMFPFSFDEYLLALGEDLLVDVLLHAKTDADYPAGAHEKLWDHWRYYLVVGGLPEVVASYVDKRDELFLALNIVREKQLALVNEYIKDMAKHSGSTNALHLERVFRSVPAQLARAQDDSVGRFRFKGVVPGISQYSRLVSAFDWLVGAGLVYKIPIIPSALAPLSQFEKESFFKLYVFDTGLLGALGDIPPPQFLDFEFGTYKGYVAENYVLQAIKTSGVGKVYGWNEKMAEIEFLFNDFDGPVPVEVKSGRVTQAKSLGVFMKRYSPKKAYIFGTTPIRDEKVAKTLVLRRPIYTAGLGEGRVQSIAGSKP